VGLSSRFLNLRLASCFGLDVTSKYLVKQFGIETAESCCVLVNYHSHDDVEKLLGDSTFRALADCAVWVVDNSADQNEEQKLTDICEMYEVNLIVPRSNLGYLGGAKVAFDEHCGVYGFPEYVLIGNVDLKFVGAGWPKLFRFIRECNGSEESNVMMVAPDIRDAKTGRGFNPFMVVRPGRIRMALIVGVFSTPLIRAGYSTIREKFGRSGNQASDDRAHAIYAGHGALFVLTKEFFLRGGRLSWPVLLYGEELYLAEQIRTLSGQVIFAPWLKALHVGHGSTGGRKRSWQFALHGRALRVLIKRYWFPWSIKGD